MKLVWHSIKGYVPAVLLDAALVVLCFLSALLLRFDWDVPDQYASGLRQTIVFWVFIYCATNYVFGLYRHMWRYASAQEVITIFEAAAVGTALSSLDVVLSLSRPIPVTVVVVGGIFTFGAFTLVRYRWRLVTGFMWRWRLVRSAPGKRVLVIGAGEAGQLLAWRLTHEGAGYEVVGFIDDDPKKQGMRVHGAKVLGNRHDIREIVASEMVDMIVVAIHTISDRDLRDMVSICLETNALVKVAPNIFDIMDNKEVGPVLFRDITIEDIAGRKPAEIDLLTCQQLVQGKVVLVTGAGGSVGSELCRQIVKLRPRLLLMLDNNETALHDIRMEFSHYPDLPPVKAVVADILRVEKMERVFATRGPEIVFHCAAYKHVPLMEEHPDESVWVNVHGTRILYSLSSKYHTERFVFISTDKAVDPSSVMGACKRIGEMLVTSLPEDSKTRFTAVRFGNVLNSRGSVIPTFLRQIEMGGPITVTDPEMSRFFLGIPEAVSLVLQAAAFTEGRDVFMLDMGEEMRILDLAEKMIRMRGLRVGKDIKIVFTGARPGEKLNEELLLPEFEERVLTPHPRIFRVHSNHRVERAALLSQIDALVALCYKEEPYELVTRLHSLAKSNGVSMEARNIRGLIGLPAYGSQSSAS
ncbi:MAG: polysaccharide biosynthesis protein [Chloroflexi bacterium]|nr:polysaccharide biosynthesis protein [Chloroflexota bacterium]